MFSIKKNAEGKYDIWEWFENARNGKGAAVVDTWDTKWEAQISARLRKKGD